MITQLIVDAEDRAICASESDVVDVMGVAYGGMSS